MSKSGQLRLELVDVHGERLAEKVDVFLRHRTLTEIRAARRVDASKRFLIRNLRAAPQGLHQLQIDAPSYRPVNWLVDIASSGVTHRRIVLPVNPAKVIRLQCPDYENLPHAHALLEASGTVLDFAGKQGRDLYDAVDDIRKAGLLNIITKAHLTCFRNEASVLSYFRQLKELRGDRFHVLVSHELRENVKNSVQDDLFTHASDLLHRPPDGYTRAGSFKTPDPFGNLQLSFFVRDGEWMADVDIDDAGGFGHVFQVARNALTGQPTHPYDIHQILIERQAMDPGYRFVLYE
jgi:hypothetical protein